MRPVPSLPRSAALIALSSVLYGCSESTEPVQFVQPQLFDFEISQKPFAFQGDWGLFFRAVADTDSLNLLMRIAVDVRTSSGDHETLDLRQEMGYIRDRVRYRTDGFLIQLTPGTHMEQLRPQLREVNGRLGYVSYDGSWGHMRLFGGDLDRAMQVVSRWPGVREVQKVTSTLQDLSRTDWIWIIDHRVARTALVQFASPVLGDSVIQTQDGDTIVVVYQQPDGSTTTTEAIMCHPPPSGGEPLVGLGEIPPCGAR